MFSHNSRHRVAGGAADAKVAEGGLSSDALDARRPAEHGGWRERAPTGLGMQGGGSCLRRSSAIAAALRRSSVIQGHLLSCSFKLLREGVAAIQLNNRQEWRVRFRT